MNRSRPSRAGVVGFGAVLAANLVPLVGVAAWNWNLSALLALYWLEAVLTSVLAALKALFAERASETASASVQPLGELREKRGGVRVRDDWPPIYVRNVPFAVGILGISAVAWLGYGLLLAIRLSIRPSAVLSVGLFAGAVGLLAARLVEFRVEYVGRGEYTDVSARRVAATPARQLLLLVLLVPFAGQPETGGTALLVGVVSAKLASESVGFYADHGSRIPGRLGEWLLGPRDAPEPPEITVPEREPDVRVRTDGRAVLLSAFVPVAAGLASRPGYAAVIVLVAGGLAFGWVVATVAAVAVAILVAAKLAAHYLRFGTVEYQRRGDHLVAYDTLLDEPQWATTVGRLHGVSVENPISDRLLGTGTLSLSGIESNPDSTVRLGPVPDLDGAVEALGLPVFDASRPESNRVMVAAAFGLAACFLVVPAGLFVAPGVSTGEAVAVSLALGPFFAFVVGLLAMGGLSRV